jgi:hypothetical protein
MFVVVRYQHRLQLPLTEDQHPMEQLTTDGANPPLRERIRPRCLHRRAHDPDALGTEDRIEAVGELRVPIANQELELPDAVRQVHQQVAGLLDYPSPSRVGRHPQDVDAAAGDLHHKQHIQPPEQHCVDVEEVARQHALGLCGQELPPGRPRPARRRIDAGAFEEQPHGARRHPVPKLHELAVDAPIPPGRVLRRHPQDQVPQGWRQRGSTRWAVGTRPVATDQTRCQRRVSGVTRRWCRCSFDRSRVKAARTARSGQVGRGLVTCRRSTATSCRSTSSSAFLEVCPRASSVSQPRSWHKIRLEESDRHGRRSLRPRRTDAKPHVDLGDDVSGTYRFRREIAPSSPARPATRGRKACR